MSTRKVQPLLMALFFALLVGIAAGQSLTSGDLTGVVTDSTGAVIPSATVTLKNTGTGATQTTTTNGQGAYRFSLLNPGDYTISAEGKGFTAAQQSQHQRGADQLGESAIGPGRGIHNRGSHSDGRRDSD